MEKLLETVRAHFAANGGYDLIMQDGVTVYTIADDIAKTDGGYPQSGSLMDLVAAIRIVLDEIEPE